jgi:NADH-quinone oxidoreductase subunit L
VAAAALGIMLAYMFYIRDPNRPKALAEKYGGIYKTLLNKYYIDEFYNVAIVRPIVAASLFLWNIVDVKIVDGIANGSAGAIGWFSGRFRMVQTGLVRNYALLFVLGVIALLGFMLFKQT